MTQRFSLQLAAFAEKFSKNAELVVRKVGIEAHSRIVLRTPVDTGRARANWTVSLDTIKSPVTQQVDATGTETLAKGYQVLVGYKLNRVIYIANALPYIERLEDGYSGQAPNGMVGLTVREFQGLVNRAVEGVKRGGS